IPTHRRGVATMSRSTAAPEKRAKDSDGGMPRGPHGMAMGGEKPKSFGAALRRLARFCRPFAPLLILAVLLETVSSMIRLVGPVKLSEITVLIAVGLTGAIDVAAIRTIVVFLLTI